MLTSFFFFFFFFHHDKVTRISRRDAMFPIDNILGIFSIRFDCPLNCGTIVVTLMELFPFIEDWNYCWEAFATFFILFWFKWNVRVNVSRINSRDVLIVLCDVSSSLWTLRIRALWDYIKRRNFSLNWIPKWDRDDFFFSKISLQTDAREECRREHNEYARF